MSFAHLVLSAFSSFDSMSLHFEYTYLDTRYIGNVWQPNEFSIFFLFCFYFQLASSRCGLLRPMQSKMREKERKNEVHMRNALVRHKTICFFFGREQRGRANNSGEKMRSPHFCSYEPKRCRSKYKLHLVCQKELLTATATTIHGDDE